MDIAIVGSRSFDDYSFFKKKLLELLKKEKISITKIISGGANGVDKMAEKFADSFNIQKKVYKPDWDKGRSAGFERNGEIVKNSDVVIAFWDGVSNGTKDTINKTKKSGKKVFVVDVSKNLFSEGVSLVDGEYVFDRSEDKKDDVLNLKFKKKNIKIKKTKGLVSYYTYKIKDNENKTDFLKRLKYKKINQIDYDLFLKKAVLGLFNNDYFKIEKVDLIIRPQSLSTLNLELCHLIKAKLPNAHFISESVIKNIDKNVFLDIDAMIHKNIKPENFSEIIKMFEKSKNNGFFEMKKMHPMFRKFVRNLLRLKENDRVLLNKLDGGVILVVDDFISEGTTFMAINELITKFNPKEIIYYTLTS